jgi:hypothetical protein
MMAETLTDRIAELRLALSSVRAAISAGATIDLLGFDIQVTRLLDEARQAPLDQRAFLVDALEKLHEELDAVGVELRLHRDFDAKRRAAGAYAGGDRR